MAQFVELLDNEQPLEYELAYLIEQAQNPDLGDDVKVSEDQVQDMMLNLPETLRKSLPLLVEKSSSSDSGVHPAPAMFRAHAVFLNATTARTLPDSLRPCSLQTWRACTTSSSAF